MTYVQYLALNGTLAIIGVILVSPYFIYKAISNCRFRKALEKQQKEETERIREEFRKEGLITEHRMTEEEAEEAYEYWKWRTGA